MGTKPMSPSTFIEKNKPDNRTECEKAIEILDSKLTEYKNVLEEMLSTEKKIGIVKTGPIKSKDKTYYKVEVNGTPMMVNYDKNLIFNIDKPTTLLEAETEVIVTGQSIVEVMPDILLSKRELPSFPLIDWNEIGGMKSQVKSIREAVELPLNNEKMFKEFGLKPTKGILLSGPPGCGKTLIGKAIASIVLKSNKANPDSFVYIKGAEMLSMYVGNTERAIVSLFKRCRKYTEKTGQRALVFIDEAEALLPTRGSRLSSDVETTIVPTFLSEMDGFEENSPMILLSTNLPNQIDHAILRDGRIDLKVAVERPTFEDSIEIFQIHLGKVKLSDSIDFLAKFGTEKIFNSPVKNNVSGAMIENLVKSATRAALVRKLANSKSETGMLASDMDGIKL